MAEIIDLTVSPRPDVIEISSDQEGAPSNRAGEDKKKKGQTSNDGGGICSSAQPSRAHTPNNIPHPHSASHPTIDEPGIFFFDGTAVPIAVDDAPPLEPAESNEDDNRLLLPSHVAIYHDDDRCTPAETIPPPKLSSDDEEYIEYLDYDERKAPGLVRYFEVEGEEANQSRPSVFKCKNCGAVGDHKTYECTIQICLTCGARDEHSTRSCPIGKTCYTCGMKGHINKTCPNRFSAYVASSDFRGDCDRCGSAEHNTNECPTLWRIYQYVNDEERIVIVQSRENKKQLSIGEGGEGYIGGEVWCYNCANTGHLGDDCDELPHAATFPVEHSAFSSRNVMSSPFYDAATEPVSIKRGPRERESKIDWPRLPDDWDAGAPADVGKRGKNKDKAKLEKRFREQEDQGEDWFDDVRKVRRGQDQGVRPPGPRGKTLKFGLLKDEPPSSPPSLPIGSAGSSLLARLSDPRGRTSRAKSGVGYTREPSHPSENSIRIRGAAQDHGKTGWARGEGRQDRASKQGHGPRYRGGYRR